MNAQTALATLPDSRESSEDLWWYKWWDGSNIIYYFKGQACNLSRNGYHPAPIVLVALLVQSTCDILVSEDQQILNHINDGTDIYAQSSDMWCLLENLFQVKIANEIYHMNFCDYCSSALWLTRIARSIFDRYSPIGLTYSQFRREFIAQCPCGSENPS